MRKSGVATVTATTTVTTTTTTTTKPASKINYDSTKARFFYQGMFALKRLQLSGKSKTPAKNSSSADARRR